MSFAPTRVYNVGVASGATTSSSIDLGDRGFTKLAINAVTMTTASVITVYGCDTLAGTYLPVQERLNTVSVQYQNVIIPTSTSGGFAVIDRPPFQFIQLVATAVVSGGISFTVVATQV